MDSFRADNLEPARESARKAHAQCLAATFEGAPGTLEREHWEFSFDSRPTNLTWSWRQVCANGDSVRKSFPFADLRLAVSDAVGRGFSPGSGDWVVRGMPMTARSVARRRAIALSA